MASGAPLRCRFHRVMRCRSHSGNFRMTATHVMAEDSAKDRPRTALDTSIAATAEPNGCPVVADNRRHFT